MASKVAVILLNMGGPEKESDIRPFLKNLFSDREIIQLPLQPILSRLIIFFRTPKVIENYRKIGGGSPLIKITAAQAQALEKALHAKGLDASVHMAMRYTPPRADDAVEAAGAAGAETLLVLPLYPHNSRATTGSSLNDLHRALDASSKKFDVKEITSWCDHPNYLDALAAKVREGLDAFPDEYRDQVEVVFSAHALPQKMIDDGDPYLEETKKTVQGVQDRIGPISHHLAFQSRSGPVQWMRPGTEEVIDDLAAQGKKALLMVPVSFVSDHIETLYEIDMLYKEQALERGIAAYRRSESLNTDPAFISALAKVVTDTLV
ncbi:MAG: ferrochelatase [bacterium]|nr:ferrochelatase [bacterium]